MGRISRQDGVDDFALNGITCFRKQQLVLGGLDLLLW